jgi:hypothetical protein
MLGLRGAGACPPGAQAGMQEDEQAGYGAPSNGTAKRAGAAGKGFDKQVDDEIPF